MNLGRQLIVGATYDSGDARAYPVPLSSPMNFGMCPACVAGQGSVCEPDDGLVSRDWSVSSF